MCMRFHPKEHHVLLAGTSEGLVFLCNTETGDITEKLSGTTDSYTIQRHSVINHCDRHITHFSHTDISLICLIYLLFLICLLGDSK